MAKAPLDFEDAVFDEAIRKGDFDYLELPLSQHVFKLTAILAIILGAVLIGRVAFLNIGRGSFYQSRAERNVNKEAVLPAYRGIITDRFGKTLVSNAPSFSVYLNPDQAISSGRLEEIVAELAEILELDREEIKTVLRRADLEKEYRLAIARNIAPEKIIALKDRRLPGVSIEDDFRREYAGGPAFAHIIGYSGAVKTGLEAIYDDYLKGTDGYRTVFRDALGREIEQKTGESPVPGYKLITSLDVDLQIYFYDRMRDGLRALGRDSGAGIAIQPQTGEILSLISLPSFDNNLFAVSGFKKEKNQLLSSSAKPLFNRAISGIYTPGSVIKPLVALAALREQVIAPDQQIFSAGFIEIPNPYDASKPSRFLDWKPHGWVDLRSALARSSNIYFYTIGGGFQEIKGLGIERLKEYWKKFKLGQKIGIDLPAENAGFLPDPEEKEARRGDIWRIGDTYNVAIGQGDLLVTPLQLVNFIASIANGGKIYRPFAAKKILDEQNRIIKENKPEILLDYSDWQKEIKEVQKGMEDVAAKWYGTANLLDALPIKAAGKTGSAQIANNARTNAFFVGYAPADNPEIAILVLVENSREGSLNAVPIAKDVLEWYYYNRIQNSKSKNQN
jgi:penicillin-binding protein 2